jgi:hypothetical protein
MDWIEYNKTFDEFVKEKLFKLGTLFEYMDLDYLVDEIYYLNPLQKMFCQDNNIPEESFYESELWKEWRMEKAFTKPMGSWPELNPEYKKRYDEIEEETLNINVSQVPIKRKYLVGSNDYIYDEQSYVDYGFDPNTKILRYKKIKNIYD